MFHGFTALMCTLPLHTVICRACAQESGNDLVEPLVRMIGLRGVGGDVSRLESREECGVKGDDNIRKWGENGRG